VRVVMVRQEGERAESNSCSYLNQYDAIQRDDRHHEGREYRIKSSKSRVLASNCPYQGFQLRRGRLRVHLRVGLRRRR
jgi:hypothetical protein